MTKANEREEVIGKPSETANSILSDHTEAGLVELVLKALKFAAEKHSRQRRKDSDASPYVNHLIDIAEILASVGVLQILPRCKAPFFMTPWKIRRQPLMSWKGSLVPRYDGS